MRRGFLFLLMLSILSCSSVPKTKSPDHFIVYGSDEKLYPVVLEGNLFSIDTNDDCGRIIDPTYKEVFHKLLRQKLVSMGFKEIQNEDQAYLNFGLTCLDTTEYFLKNDSEKSSKIFNLDSKIQENLKVENNYFRMTRMQDGQITNELKGTYLNKTISFRFYAYNNRNKKRPQLSIDGGIQFVEEKKFLDSEWNKAIIQLLTQVIDPLQKNLQPPFKNEPLCIPRFGWEWSKDPLDQDKYIVESVAPNSPAAALGLKKRDQILTLNALKVREFYETVGTELMEKIQMIPIQYKRKDKIYSKEVKTKLICAKAP